MEKATPLHPRIVPALPATAPANALLTYSPSPGPDALTCVVETEEEEAGMVLAKGERLSCGRDAVAWCARRLEERGVLQTARSTPPPWEIGSLLLV